MEIMSLENKIPHGFKKLILKIKLSKRKLSNGIFFSGVGICTGIITITSIL